MHEDCLCTNYPPLSIARYTLHIWVNRGNAGLSPKYTFLIKYIAKSNTLLLKILYKSSSSPFPTSWGQRPEFLISRMFCPGHPPGWSAVPAYPFGSNPSISLLVFFLALSCQQLLSLRCFLPFSACVRSYQRSLISLTGVCYSLLAPFCCPHSLLCLSLLHL